MLKQLPNILCPLVFIMLQACALRSEFIHHGPKLTPAKHTMQLVDLKIVMSTGQHFYESSHKIKMICCVLVSVTIVLVLVAVLIRV